MSAGPLPSRVRNNTKYSSSVPQLESVPDLKNIILKVEQCSNLSPLTALSQVLLLGIGLESKVGLSFKEEFGI